MVERQKIGILFNYSEGWIGGTYYFINLVNALQQLSDRVKPEILVLTSDEKSFEKIKATGYPYLKRLQAHFHYAIPERIINKLSRYITGKNLISKGYSPTELPILFGYYEQLFHYKCKRKLYWIPDLQDRYYPEYVGKDIALARNKQHEQLAYSNAEVIFSSKNAKRDFERFYPGATCNKHVVQFAVSLPGLNDGNLKLLLSKYHLPDNYFFAPNQFWPHKNHMTVIKAIELLKQSGKERTIVFTGNESAAGSAYTQKLKEYVEQHELSKLVRFLGFIDREEQLLLMKHSKAVIQASLFEGWSTVVEDAKSLNKFLIVSDLPVHREQLNKNALFFEPKNFKALAGLLAAPSFEVSAASYYSGNIVRFAEVFLDIINSD